MLIIEFIRLFTYLFAINYSIKLYVYYVTRYQIDNHRRLFLVELYL